MNSSKRIEQEFHIIRLVISIVIALAIAFLAICFVTDDPVNTIINFLFGPFQTVRRMGNIVEMTIPLLFTGVSVSIMYSCNQTNMASEGAFFLGGIAASYAAVTWFLPKGIHPLVCILFGGFAGMIVCGIPAVMYVKRGALPVVSSLMMNYVSLNLGLLIVNYVMRDPEAGYLCSYEFSETATLPHLFSVTKIHMGLVLAIITVIAGYLFLYKSRWGYSIRMVGKNKNFARYSGMNVVGVIVGCQLVGGFVAGMGGAVEQMGMYNRFQYQSLSNHGFDGVLIAILAGYNPKFVPLAAAFLAYIRVGADVMARTSDVPAEIVYIIQAIIIVFVAADRFMAKWKHKKIVQASEQAVMLKEG